MTILTDQIDAIIGVDTHTDTHSAAIITPVGVVLAEHTVPATPAGYAQLIAWAGAHTPGPRLLWALEGTRAHGIGLARALQTAAAQVVQAPAPESARRRRRGKSDARDAIAAARNVLGDEKPPAQPRTDGIREDLRLLLVTRRHYTDTRTATVNLLKSVILTADDRIRTVLRSRSTARQVSHLLTHDLPDTDPIRAGLLLDLARQIRILDQTLTDNLHQLRQLIRTWMPSLLDEPGVGPVSAAVLLTTWSHPGRVRSEAAFATLAGVSPVDASSGRNIRHRLNPGGDRTLNAALHTIATNRRRYHQPTIDYTQRRTTEGKTPAEITRCIKRYLARHFYRHLQQHATA
jgi:transposase